MVRKLKHHERKLLKKFDFINWECDNNLHEVKIMKRYHIQKREDYTLNAHSFSSTSLFSNHDFVLLTSLPHTKELSEIYVCFEFWHFSDRYNKLSRQIRDLANKLKDIDETDQWRAEMTQLFTTKLHNLGLVPTKRSLMLASKVNASCFCRRRLPVILMRSHMAETMKAAVTFVEQGHVRVGPDVVTDPAFLVTRSMEDYITWAPQSKIRKRIEEYSGIRDDYNDV
ncbi:hypothetical protein P879_09710 [Paragonimus westermani]|uniref:U3 small nucleolar ribonucleoprotein protein IMP3 n=1 Tax=Paragonimus westermani TaxID=34504 RepID=A0A8T0D1S3_9TREM|nr:hypothetical protein P879_09710 [Paragonimus westermani]